MNSHIEESYGGAGAGYLDGCLIEDKRFPGLLGHPDLARLQRVGYCSDRAGAEEIKKKYLGMLTEAPKLASLA